MPRVACRERAVIDRAEIRDLAVCLGRRRDEFIPLTEIHRQVRPPPDVVLREEAPELLTVVPNRIDLAGDREIDALGDALQEIRQIRESDDPAALAGRVLIELEGLAIIRNPHLVTSPVSE